MCLKIYDFLEDCDYFMSHSQIIPWTIFIPERKPVKYKFSHFDRFDQFKPDCYQDNYRLLILSLELSPSKANFGLKLWTKYKTSKN